MRAVLMRPVPAHYTDEMRELRLNRSLSVGSRAARIRQLERTDSRSPEMQILLREFARAQHDDPARYVRNINAFLGDYLNPPEVKPARFSSENLYEAGKRLQPFERDFLFTLVSDTKAAVVNRAPAKTISAALDDRDRQARQPDTSERGPKTQANNRAVLESPTLRQFLGASLWREAELIAASQSHSSPLAQDGRVSLAGREIEAVALLLSERRQQPKHLDAVAEYLNTSEDTQQRRLGEVLTTFREMRAARAGESQIRFEITAANDSLLARDEWAVLLDYFSLRLSDARPLNLPDAERRGIKRAAVRSAWSEIRPQALRQPEILLDAGPQALVHAGDAHRAIERGRALQERTRTAADALAAHINGIVNRTARELAKTDPQLAADPQRVEALINLALASDSIPNTNSGATDERDPAQRELLAHVSRVLTPRHREQYRMLADFADRAKEEYVGHFFSIDESLAALSLSVRKQRIPTRVAVQGGRERNVLLMKTSAEREDRALGRELGRLIESGRAEELLDGERIGKAEHVRDLLPKDVTERAREAASQFELREAQEPASASLLETLKERVSVYLTSSVREGGAEALRPERDAARHSQRITRIIVEAFGEHGSDLLTSPDHLRLVEATAAKLVGEINAAFHERARAVTAQEHEHHLGETARRAHLSPLFTAQGDKRPAPASVEYGREPEAQKLKHDDAGTVHNVGNETEHGHITFLPSLAQSQNLNSKSDLHKQSTLEVNANTRSQQPRQYVLTR